MRRAMFGGHLLLHHRAVHHMLAGVQARRRQCFERRGVHRIRLGLLARKQRDRGR